MLNLAPIRYAKVLSDEGGPIEKVEYSKCEVFGKVLIHAVAYLKEGIVDPKSVELRLSLQPDGAGCHEFTQVACYMAVSEAIERWAVHYGRTKTGFAGIDIDGSSNGFAAFPGLFRRQARRAAFRESIERHCLLCWWEGLLGHQHLDDVSDGVSCIRIENPFSKHSVVIIWMMTEFGYSFAFSAGDDAAHASRRALVELSRTQSLLRQISTQSSVSCGGGDVFERRIRYFSRERGAGLFFDRMRDYASRRAAPMKLLYDAPVKGPWDAYASVWRTIIESPNLEYLSDRDDYFFW